MVSLVFKTSLGAVRFPEGSTPSLLRQLSAPDALIEILIAIATRRERDSCTAWHVTSALAHAEMTADLYQQRPANTAICVSYGTLLRGGT